MEAEVSRTSMIFILDANAAKNFNLTAFKENMGSIFGCHNPVCILEVSFLPPNVLGACSEQERPAAEHDAKQTW